MAKRKEMLVIKIVDFTKDKDEPAYDVEVYVNEKFANSHDGVFSTTNGKESALEAAKLYAIDKILKMKL